MLHEILNLLLMYNAFTATALLVYLNLGCWDADNRTSLVHHSLIFLRRIADNEKAGHSETYYLYGITGFLNRMASWTIVVIVAVLCQPSLLFWFLLAVNIFLLETFLLESRRVEVVEEFGLSVLNKTFVSNLQEER